MCAEILLFHVPRLSPRSNPKSGQIKKKRDSMIMIMIMNLYSAFSIFIYSNALYKRVIYGQRPDPNTGNYAPYMGS